ncbi:hypothetical protein KEM52_004455, partial [Ascosphaera acerosa]
IPAEVFQVPVLQHQQGDHAAEDPAALGVEVRVVVGVVEVVRPSVLRPDRVEVPLARPVEVDVGCPGAGRGADRGVALGCEVGDDARALRLAFRLLACACTWLCVGIGIGIGISIGISIGCLADGDVAEVAARQRRDQNRGGARGPGLDGEVLQVRGEVGERLLALLELLVVVAELDGDEGGVAALPGLADEPQHGRPVAAAAVREGRGAVVTAVRARRVVEERRL